MDLDFLIRRSKNTDKKAGSIFMFHGYGSNKEDLFSLEQYLPQSHTIISLEAPIKLRRTLVYLALVKEEVYVGN